MQDIINQQSVEGRVSRRRKSDNKSGQMCELKCSKSETKNQSPVSDFSMDISLPRFGNVEMPLTGLADVQLNIRCEVCHAEEASKCGICGFIHCP